MPDELAVYLNGNFQTAGALNDYEETSPTSITFTIPLVSTDQVIIRKSDSAPLDNGLVTTANISGGRISVSYIAAGSAVGLTDLSFEVRDPTDTQVAVGIPLLEYFGRGHLSAPNFA